jgi:hypothetical protein
MEPFHEVRDKPVQILDRAGLRAHDPSVLGGLIMSINTCGITAPGVM